MQDGAASVGEPDRDSPGTETSGKKRSSGVVQRLRRVKEWVDKARAKACGIRRSATARLVLLALLGWLGLTVSYFSWAADHLQQNEWLIGFLCPAGSRVLACYDDLSHGQGISPERAGFKEVSDLLLAQLGVVAPNRLIPAEPLVFPGPEVPEYWQFQVLRVTSAGLKYRAYIGGTGLGAAYLAGIRIEFATTQGTKEDGPFDIGDLRQQVLDTYIHSPFDRWVSSLFLLGVATSTLASALGARTRSTGREANPVAANGAAATLSGTASNGLIVAVLEQNWLQARHAETERLAFASIAAGIVGGITGFYHSASPEAQASLHTPLFSFVLVICVFGTLMSWRFKMVFDDHLKRIAALVDAFGVRHYMGLRAADSRWAGRSWPRILGVNWLFVWLFLLGTIWAALVLARP